MKRQGTRNRPSGVILYRTFPDQPARSRVNDVEIGLEVAEIEPVDPPLPVGSQNGRAAHFAIGTKCPPDAARFCIERIDAAIGAPDEDRFARYGRLRACTRSVWKRKRPFEFEARNIGRRDAAHAGGLIAPVFGPIPPAIPQRRCIERQFSFAHRTGGLNRRRTQIIRDQPALVARKRLTLRLHQSIFKRVSDRRRSAALQRCLAWGS